MFLWLNLKPPYLIHYFTLSNVQRLQCSSRPLCVSFSCVFSWHRYYCPRPMSPHMRCGGSSLCVSWVQESGRATKWPPVWTPTITARPTQSHHSHNLQVTQTFKLESPISHPSSLSSSSKRSRVDSDLIESVFVKGGSVIVTRKSHHWAQHDPNNSHELLFHDDSLLMRFPNPSFNFFLASSGAIN